MDAVDGKGISERREGIGAALRDFEEAANTAIILLNRNEPEERTLQLALLKARGDVREARGEGRS